MSRIAAERIKIIYQTRLHRLDHDVRAGLAVEIAPAVEAFGRSCAQPRTRLIALQAILPPRLHRRARP